jgi:hypothetical protein
MPRSARAAAALRSEPTEPFCSAEAAWLWTMRALIARREGASVAATFGRIARPCEPDDVVSCLDRLYRARQIDLAQARVLRRWGERGTPPDPRHPREAADAMLWHQALAELAPLLRSKGIAAGPEPPA